MANKANLVDYVGKGSKFTKRDVTDIINKTLEGIVVLTAQDGSTELTNFGTFKVQDRAAREGRNPHTGETLHIDKKQVPKFKASPSFKNAVK